MATLFIHWLICLFMTTSNLWCNNMSAVHLSANLDFHFLIKHVDQIEIYFARDLVQQRKVRIQHLLATAQIATCSLNLYQLLNFFILKIMRVYALYYYN